MSGSDIFLCFLSILFPPVGVWIKRGICSADSLINLALCCLGFLPGLLHAWYIIYSYPDTVEYQSVSQDPEQRNAHVAYYYVQGPVPARQQPQSHAQPQPGYGTVHGPAGSAPSRGQFPGQQSGTVNSFPAPKQAKGSSGAAQGGQGSAGQGSSSNGEEVPPSYADAIKGDHKVQTQK